MRLQYKPYWVYKATNLACKLHDHHSGYILHYMSRRNYHRCCYRSVHSLKTSQCIRQCLQ